MSDVKICMTFTAVPTDIHDALCLIRINGEAHQVLYAIMRKTWGFLKEEDWIAMSQMVELTGLAESRINRGVNKLLAMNIIYRKYIDGYPHYSINYDCRTWVPLEKKSRGNKKVNAHSQKSESSPAFLSSTIDNNTIDTGTRESDACPDGRAGGNAQSEYLERLEKNIAKGKAASNQAYNKRLLTEFEELCSMASNMCGIYKKVTPSGFRYYCYRRSFYPKQEIFDAFKNALNDEEWRDKYKRSSIEFFLYNDERISCMRDCETLS